MKRLIGFGMLASAFLLTPAFSAEDSQSNKEALQELQALIGQWNGVGGGGTPERPKADPKFWKETLEWGWRFKGDDCCLILNIKDSKFIKEGEMRYLPTKKIYQLKGKDIKDKEVVFEGAFQKGYLTLERVDPETKATQQIKMNLAGEGIRLIYRFASKAEGRTLFTPEYYVSATKEGESLALKPGKNSERECVVSGGLGNGTVSFKGVTYYICCSGCRDEFNANPEKYVKEFEEKKKKAAGK